MPDADMICVWTFELTSMLQEYEQKYGYSTIEFYRRYMAGTLGDDDDLMMWAGLYHLYLTSKPVCQFVWAPSGRAPSVRLLPPQGDGGCPLLFSLDDLNCLPTLSKLPCLLTVHSTLPLCSLVVKHCNRSPAGLAQRGQVGLQAMQHLHLARPGSPVVHA
jgi:hypothetical protein